MTTSAFSVAVLRDRRDARRSSCICTSISAFLCDLVCLLRFNVLLVAFAAIKLAQTRPPPLETYSHALRP